MMLKARFLLPALAAAATGMHGHAAVVTIVTDDASAEAAYATLIQDALGASTTVNVATNYRSLDPSEIATLNASDLVIVSRNTDSGQYDDGSEPAEWNAVTAPLLLNNPLLARNTRWDWMQIGTTTTVTPPVTLRAPNAASPDPTLDYYPVSVHALTPPRRARVAA